MTAKTELEPSLASLVTPLEPQAFLADYWKKKPFFSEGTPERLERLFLDLGSPAPAALIWNSAQCHVWSPPGSPLPRWPQSMDAALHAYEHRGATLYLHLGTEHALCAWSRALAYALGEPPLYLTSLFLARGGSGSAPHYDRNENFTIQLRGTKRWRVAPNGFITNPVENWTIGEPPPAHADPALVPTEMPADAQEFLLTPGSVLYVPRGYLHHVTAVQGDDSLSLNFNFPPLTWGGAFLRLLKLRFEQQPGLRESLDGAFGSGWGRAPLVDELPTKLAELGAQVQSLDLGALVAMLQDPKTMALFRAEK
jgi:50S ribosomal protein L16 3-hydroxylase